MVPVELEYLSRSEKFSATTLMARAGCVAIRQFVFDRAGRDEGGTARSKDHFASLVHEASRGGGTKSLLASVMTISLSLIPLLMPKPH